MKDQDDVFYEGNDKRSLIESGKHRNRGEKMNQNKVLCFVIGLIAIGAVIIGIIFLIKGTHQTNKGKDDIHPIKIIAAVTDKSSIVRNQSGLFLSNIISTKIEEIIIEDSSRINISFSQFPNVRSLNFKDKNMKTLELDPLLNLLNLSIISTGLTTFTYNSSTLLNFLLFNNSNIQTISNCTLQALTNFTIINSNIEQWINNTFGNNTLIKIKIQSDYNYKYPTIQNVIDTLELVDCYVADQIAPKKLKNLIVYNSTIALKVSNNQFLQVLKFNNCNFKISEFKNMSNLKIVFLSQPQNHDQKYGFLCYNCMKLKDLILEFKHLSFLRLVNTSLQSMEIQKSAITALQIINTPLKFYGFDNFLALSQLYLDCKHIFNIDSLIEGRQIQLHWIYLINYNGPLNIWGQYELYSISLQSCNLSSVSLYRPKYVTINNITMPNFQLNTFYNHKLEYLNIIGNIKLFKIQNWNFPQNFSQLYIKDNPYLKSITNSSIWASFYIINCSQLETIKNNSIHISYNLCIKNNPKLKWQQSFQAFSYSDSDMYTAVLDGISLDDLKYFVQYSSQIIDLTLQNFTSNTFNITAQKMKNLAIESNYQCIFKSTEMKDLKILILTNFTKIYNNNLISLKQLNIINNPKLNISQLIQQFESWKSKGTDLQKLSLPSSATDKDKQDIKTIFPNIIFE